MNNIIEKYVSEWQGRGYLHLVFLLFAESLVIGFVVFAGLFSIETLLPTFITARLSLAKFLFLLVVGLFGLFALGRRLNIRFEKPTTTHPFFTGVLALWGILLLALSLYKFPLWSIPITISLFIGSGSLFWSIFFGENEKPKE